MNEFLSNSEMLKKSKSMTLHSNFELEPNTIKQIGDYKLGREIGSGAFGKVVLGKHTLTGESVAIKILNKIILSQTPEDYQLVKQEISILKIVKHKYIVHLYEILQTPQHIYIIMEYCEGKDLMDYILSKQRLSELESLKYFQQLINALFYLHSQNIAHRDVKIDNMLLDKNLDLKLVDFGLSTKYADDALLDQPCGTVVYAAPEVLDGNEYHGMLADVWSSGIVLYGLASGYLPFSDPDDEVNKKDVLEGKIDIPEFFSPLLKDLLKHMLDIDPVSRYTLQEIRQHPWFNLNKINLIPGIIIGYNNIPVDENILNLCVAYNADKDKIEQSVKNNKYDSGSALYYLLVRKITRNGFQSVSDLSSEAFIEFILNDDNLINRKIIFKKKKKSDNYKQKKLIEDKKNSNPFNKKEYYLSASKNMENLSPAPRFLPIDKTINNKKTISKEKRKEKKEVLIKQKKRNKINSLIKENEHRYTTKNSSDMLTKKPFILNKYEMYVKNKNNKNIQRRLNNSVNLRTRYNKKENTDKNDNKSLSILKDEYNVIKSKPLRNKKNDLNLNENNSLEFKSGTNQINSEINNKKIREKKTKEEYKEIKENKSPIMNNKKNIKQSTLEIYKKNSKNKIKINKKKNKNDNNDSIIKKEKITNSIQRNIKKTKKEKFDKSNGNSCINIKTNNYAKTPSKKNNVIHAKNIIQNSRKNIYYNERNIGKKIFENKKEIYLNLNTSASDKFTIFKNYERNKHQKNISNSIQSKYKSKYNDGKKNERDIILSSSNKKRDYSLNHKRNNIISILGINKKKLKSLENTIVHDIYDSSKLFLSVRKKKDTMYSLNLSLNKSKNDNNKSKYNNDMKNRKQTEYETDNIIYELNNQKNKNKNKIRLDYNPNKIYELTFDDVQKKKNNLNTSATIDKTDDKKVTGLSIYMNMNNYSKQNNKKANLESSSFANRKIYSYSIRDLSYSPNTNFVNKKTRKERIPWRYHKKGLDNKLTTETIYNKYINRTNKNPLNTKGNKKIKIRKKEKDLLYESKTLINNNIFQTFKNDNKILNQTLVENPKEIKEEKRRLSQEKREKKGNNYHRDKTNYNLNMQEKNELSGKKLNSSISNKNKMKLIEHELFKGNKGNNNFNIFDLSCLVVKENNIKECNQALINKLKMNGFNIISNKINEIKCSKNKMNCQIDIVKIKCDNNSDKNILYYKINNKRVETQINKMISNVI